MSPAAPSEPIVDLSLAPSPPMGFNTWNRFRGRIDEGLLLQTGRVLVDSGMAAAGYRYLNLDDAWMAPHRDGTGNLVADPERFPRGIAALADDVHAMGLKLGIYSDAGTQTCMGLPASFGNEERDAASFAEWGVDYLKYDWCHVPFDDFPGQSQRQVAEQLYTKMAGALVATGRPIVFSMCNWGGERVPWLWARGIAHLWRTTGDIDVHGNGSVGTLGFLEIFRHNVTLAEYAGPGGWNDPDMLEVGNGMSDDEDRAHFGLWAMMAAPLLAGNDLRTMSDATREILLNAEVIAIDQDPQGQQCRVVRQDGPGWVLRKQLAGGRVAVAAFNDGVEPRRVELSDTDARSASERATPGRWRDVWAHSDVGAAPAVELPAHGIATYVVS